MTTFIPPWIGEQSRGENSDTEQCPEELFHNFPLKVPNSNYPFYTASSMPEDTCFRIERLCGRAKHKQTPVFFVEAMIRPALLSSIPSVLTVSLLICVRSD
jgi:hypothetical protein